MQRPAASHDRRPREPRAILSPGRTCLRCASAFDHQCGRMAWHDLDQDNLASERLHDLATDDLLTGVVAAFDQYSRLYAADQLFRCVLVEHGNKVNRFKSREHFRARLYRLHGTAGTFQSRNRCITIEAYNQSVASRPRARQQLDVPGMQEIEAPIGEPDPQTLFPPFGEMVVEYSPIENNLFLRRQCRRRQYPRAKLGDRSGCCAALA